MNSFIPHSAVSIRRLLTAALCLTLAGALHAQSTWTGPTSGTNNPWNNNSNWNTSFPNAGGAVVNLNADFTAASSVVLNQGITVGTLNFGDSDGSHTLTLGSGTGTNTLTLDSGSSGGNVAINLLTGAGAVSQDITAGITIASNNTLTINTAGTRLRTTGTITTNNNDIIVDGSGAVTTTWFLDNANLNGGGRIILKGFGSLLVTGPTNNFTGSVFVNRGTGLNSAGSLILINGSMRNASEQVITGLLGGTGITQSGGIIEVGNNSGQATPPGQRLTENTLTLAGGTLRHNGQSGSADIGTVQDKVDVLKIGAGYSHIRISVGANHNRGTVLEATTLNRSAGGSLYVSGSNMGGAVGTIGNTGTQVILGNADAYLRGAGGAAGSATMSIIPWMGVINGNSNGPRPDTFAVYTATGVRALSTGEQSGSLTAGTDHNVLVSNMALASDATVNSLQFSLGSASNMGAGRILTVSSGGVFLSTNSGGIGAAGNPAAGTLHFGTAEGVVWANGANSNGIGSAITGSGGLTKAGTGILVLTGSNSYSGNTHVGAGTLRVGDGTNSSSLGLGDVYVAAGAVLDLRNDGALNSDYNLRLLNHSEFGGFLTGSALLAAGTNNTVNGLFFGSSAQTFGTWGATGSGATNINDVYFAGTGMLTVIPEPSTISLILTFGLVSLTFFKRRKG